MVHKIDEPAAAAKTARLSSLAATIGPNSTATRGSGFRAWDTRRANKFKRAVSDLAHWKLHTFDELRDRAADVSETLCERLASAAELPRGYSIGKTREGDLSLKLRNVFFGPSFREAPASPDAIARLGEDLKTGLLAEIEQQILGLGR